jgi:hypothetical protein
MVVKSKTKTENPIRNEVEEKNNPLPIMGMANVRIRSPCPCVDATHRPGSKHAPDSSHASPRPYPPPRIRRAKAPVVA